jgi:hypothetical protein
VVRRVLAKHYRPAPYDGGPSWATFLRYTRDSLSSIALFRRESVLPRIHSNLLAIGQFTRRIIGCGISGRHFNQSVFCSLFDTAIPVIDASRPLRSIHHQAISHHRCRRKLLGLGRTRKVTMLPRSPPVAGRRIRTRRRKHHNYRSNYRAIDLEAKHGILNNFYNLLLIPSPFDEIRSSRINRETALSHAESENFARKRYCREELSTLIAA